MVLLVPLSNPWVHSLWVITLVSRGLPQGEDRIKGGHLAVLSPVFKVNLLDQDLVTDSYHLVSLLEASRVVLAPVLALGEVVLWLNIARHNLPVPVSLVELKVLAELLVLLMLPADSPLLPQGILHPASDRLLDPMNNPSPLLDVSSPPLDNVGFSLANLLWARGTLPAGRGFSLQLLWQAVPMAVVVGLPVAKMAHRRTFRSSALLVAASTFLALVAAISNNADVYNDRLLHTTVFIKMMI